MSDISQIEFNNVVYSIKDTEARRRVSEFESENASLASSLEAANSDIDNIQVTLESKVDDAYVDDGYLYMTAGGDIIVGPLGPFSGTGGGGGGGSSSGNNAVLLVSNTSGWLTKSVASGSSCEISVKWSSIEDELPTGNGVIRISVGGTVKYNANIEQGDVTVDISQYLATGSNSVKVYVTDTYGNSKSVNYTVNVISLSVNSAFDSSSVFTGPITFTYTPVGEIQKTIYIKLDGEVIGTTITTSSGRQLSYEIPQQTHGSHSIEVYFTGTVSGETVESNHLYYDVICVSSGDTTPIISSAFNTTSVEKYTSVVIKYTVYDPSSLTTNITLSENGEVTSSQTVDRTEQTWTYRAIDEGETTLAITCGDVVKSFDLTVTESSMDIAAVEENLSLYLTSYGRSNNEENPGIWEYEDVQCSMTGFNYSSDGWQKDDDDISVLRVSGDARVVIPVKPLATDSRTLGKTIEIEFATRDVMNYDSVILSCLDDNRGFSLTSQKAVFKSEQSEISTQYKENEHVRISFVVEKKTENKLAYCYINGIMSGVIQYPDDDDFSQKNPVDISIGSNDCTIDIYCIRIYENDLTRHQILDNWIADTQDVEDMLDRYSRNDLCDAYDNIVISKLPSYLPYIVLEAEELPQYKGDKKTISGYYVNPEDTSLSFTFTGAQADVQGTSSQYYARKNYKIKFKGGFTDSDGNKSDTYAMNSNAVPTNIFTFKADVASSEGCNNVELVRLYNEICPYKTPGQSESSKVRQGIDGFPIVMFWNNGSTTTFLGKYNFNNDKGTPEVFGFVDGDESWEVLNNTSNRVLWKSADYTGTDWLNDFEARYPETDPAYEDATQLAEFAAWVVSTDTTAATNESLSESVVIDDVTYTIDSAEYRLAKFKSEFGNYVELNSALFYYMFTELFLMIDSRAKNMFPSFMGSDVNEEG